MAYEEVVMIFKDAVMTIITVSSPMLIGALITGLIVAIFQATTQINEQTLAFVPKILCVFIILIILGPWILENLTEYTTNLFENILRMVL